MARLALFGIAVIIVILVARLIFPSSSSKEPNPTEMVQDPNNGVYIPKTEAIKKTIKGKEYYFSSEQSAKDYINKNQTKTD
jgi:YHS domain-containing protein